MSHLGFETNIVLRRIFQCSQVTAALRHTVKHVCADNLGNTSPAYECKRIATRAVSRNLETRHRRLRLLPSGTLTVLDRPERVRPHSAESIVRHSHKIGRAHV